MASAKKPMCPARLSKNAKREWRAVTKRVDEMGLLSDTDRAVLARYAVMSAELVECEEWIETKGRSFPIFNKNGDAVNFKPWPEVRIMATLREQLLRIEGKFGLNPSARADLSVPEESGDNFDGFVESNRSG